MEFMDRRQRSILVQFWLNVDTLKDPLESSDPLGSTPIGSPDASSSSTMSEDIKLIYDLYFATSPGGGEDMTKKFKPNPVIQAVSPRHVEIIRSFLLEDDHPQESSDSPLPSNRARQAVMLAQKTSGRRNGR